MKMEDFIDTYKDNFTTYALVFKFMKIQYTLTNIMVVILAFSTYSIIVALPTTIIVGFTILKVLVVIYGCVLLLTLLFLVWFIYSAKKIIFKRYDILSSNGAWRSKEFDDHQSQLLIDYLKSKKVYTADKLKILITNLEAAIKQKKSPSVWTAGVFLALFTPLWNQYMTYLFKMAEGEDWLNVSKIVLVASVVIVFISLFVGGFKKILFFLQDLFMTEKIIV
ncbi:hypothetical protein ACE3MZ_02425 [Paenibacillus sp. WLX1005]|uniref:hypothetical protein n=1 Tax=Paenibacillus sp. WLX1005 TaxID=3243766 RepID=UPI003983E6AB